MWNCYAQGILKETRGNTKTSKLENIKHVELKKWSDYDTLDVSIASDHLGYYLDIYANDASNRLGYIRILSE